MGDTLNALKVIKGFLFPLIVSVVFLLPTLAFSEERYRCKVQSSLGFQYTMSIAIDGSGEGVIDLPLQQDGTLQGYVVQENDAVLVLTKSSVYNAPPEYIEQAHTLDLVVIDKYSLNIKREFIQVFGKYANVVSDGFCMNLN